MFGIGPWELIVVFAIVLLLFGGKRLPGLASGLGNAIRNFKTALKEPEADANTKLIEAQDAKKPSAETPQA
jgi:sec-independent protein translocase protein TatA